jgi:hypothetical protein
MSHRQRLVIAPDWRISEVMMALARGLQVPSIGHRDYGIPPHIPPRLNNNQIQVLMGLPEERLKREIFQHIEKSQQIVKNISPYIYSIVTENQNILYEYEELRVLLQKNYEKIQELFVKYKQCLSAVKNQVVDQVCSICTEKCSDMVILEECKHTFCRECILKWAENNNLKCPNCRGVSVFLFRNQPLSPIYNPFEDVLSRYYGMADESSVKSEIIENIFETVEGMSSDEKLCFIGQNRDSIKNKQMFIRLGSVVESLNRIYSLLHGSVNDFEKLRKIEVYYSREKFDLEVTDWCFLEVQKYLDEKLALQLQEEIRQEEIRESQIRESQNRPNRPIPSLVIFPADDDVYVPSSPLYVQRRRNIIQTPVSP